MPYFNLVCIGCILGNGALLDIEAPDTSPIKGQDTGSKGKASQEGIQDSWGDLWELVNTLGDNKGELTIGTTTKEDKIIVLGGPKQFSVDKIDQINKNGIKSRQIKENTLSKNNMTICMNHARGNFKAKITSLTWYIIQENTNRRLSI